MTASTLGKTALAACSVLALGACASWWDGSKPVRDDHSQSAALGAGDKNMSNRDMPASTMGTAGTSANTGDSIMTTRDTRQSTSAEPASPDADMQAVLDAHTALGAKPFEQLAPAQARAQPSLADAVKQVMKQRQPGAAKDTSVTTQDVTYPSDGTTQKARIYKPAKPSSGMLPIVVYFHGGGWVIADLDVYDATPRAIAKDTGAIVVSVGYRQAPENRFPAAHEDANAAYQWVLNNAAKWGGDPERIAVAGESAGGNLAANVAITARDKGLTEPRHMLLVYPVAQTDMNTPSYVQYADAAPLNRAGMMWFVKHTFSDPAQVQDTRINLVAANLNGLPPATLVLAEIDPLQDDGHMLADRLKAAGGTANLRVYEGATHEFFGMAAVNSDAKEAQAWAFDRLKADLAR